MNEELNNNLEEKEVNDSIQTPLEQEEVLDEQGDTQESETVQKTPEQIAGERALEIKRIEDQGVEIDPKIIKRIIRLGIIGFILFAVYFIFLNPIIKFKSYEKTMLKAAERYYELNPDKLPTGNRVGTISLQTLFTEKYIDKDFYIPFTKSPCNTNKSWVKTRTINNETKNYVYLYCGAAFQSRVDHKGPKIVLNGDEKVTINKGDDYKDPGVKSVKDSTDGELNIKDVTIKNKVDTSKVGVQTITYTAYDYLNNKSTVTREITIVERIGHAVSIKTKDGYFKGYNPKNYLMFGRNLYRIVGLDKDKNVQIVSNDEVGNVNYDGLEDYLNDFYELLPEKSKNLIVESTYCNMTLTDNNLDTTECSSYTDNKKVYILSIDTINKSIDNDETFLHDFAWTANIKDKTNSYVVTDLLAESVSMFMSQNNNSYFGVKPLLTIKGDILIKEGTGSRSNPYILKGDVARAKPGEKVYDRIPGEYIKLGGKIWRILKTESEQPTKIISAERLRTSDGVDVRENNSQDSSSKFIYNPKKKGNIGYIINNQASRYINTKYLVKHEIEVPIYKKNVLYKKEIDTKKYTVKYSAPNVFDIYAIGEDLPYGRGEYYHLNSSQAFYSPVILSETGIPEFLQTTRYVRYGIKVVSYLNKEVDIVSGKGTLDNPYVVSD